MTVPTGDEAALRDYCLPFIRGQRQPETAAELMASRYVAYALSEIDYILDTHDPQTRDETDRESVQEWASHSTFHGLSILSTQGGEPGDDSGEVEFKALFTSDGQEHVHHERAQFVRREGRWYFTSGRQVQEPARRSQPKVGRNDPCPCGSGKKYKKCHG